MSPKTAAAVREAVVHRHLLEAVSSTEVHIAVTMQTLQVSCANNLGPACILEVHGRFHTRLLAPAAAAHRSFEAKHVDSP